jgi:hypothetical protein
MSENELLIRLAAAKTQYEYDNLVDKYLFDIDKKNRNTKNNRKHNMLTANQMQQIERKEKPYDFSKSWI